MKYLSLLLTSLFLVGCTNTTEPDQALESDTKFRWEIIDGSTTDYKLSYPRFTAGPEAIVESLNTDLPTGIASFVDQANAFATKVAVDPSLALPQPWELSMTPSYQYADDVFYSLLLDTYDYSGGERGNSYYGVINYHVPTESFIAVSDLFADETYLKPLAEFVRSEIVLQRGSSDEALEQATAPDIKNFRVFTFEDGPEGRGLKFYFAPYQLGEDETAYSILVPVGILSGFVKDKYQAWFNFVPVSAADYIGMNFTEAQALAKERGVPIRKVMEDGQPLPATADWRPGRINATVVNGVVVSYEVEGQK